MRVQVVGCCVICLCCSCLLLVVCRCVVVGVGLLVCVCLLVSFVFRVWNALFIMVGDCCCLFSCVLRFALVWVSFPLVLRCVAIVLFGCVLVRLCACVCVCVCMRWICSVVCGRCMRAFVCWLLLVCVQLCFFLVF